MLNTKSHQNKEYKKLVELRAAKTRKLESQLRDLNLGGAMQSSVGWGRGQEETGQVTRTSVNTHVGQTIFCGL